MRVTGYKLAAKSIINENLGKCLLSSVLILFPKFSFACCLFVLWLAYRADFLTTTLFVIGIIVSFVIMFVLNSIFIPIGELLLFEIADDESSDADEFENTCISIPEDDSSESLFDTALDVALEFAFAPPEMEATREFHLPFEYAATSQYEKFNTDTEGLPEVQLFEIAKTMRSFGFGRLIKLRFFLLKSLARDVALTSLPAMVLVAGLIAYALYAPLPIAAFVALSIGSIAILLLAFMELELEYDKYRFVYMSIPEFTKDFYNYSYPYKSMLLKSTETAGEKIAYIRRCEVSFWGWEIFSLILLPLLIPILYLLPYKKLTLYNVIM